MILQITNKEAKINDNYLTVLIFSASWCGPCKKIAPSIEKLSNEYTNTKFYSIDTDNSDLSDLVDKYNVSALPTFVFLKNGKVLTTVCGALLDDVKENIVKYN